MYALGNVCIGCFPATNVCVPSPPRGVCGLVRPQLVGILRASVPLFKDMPAFKDFKTQLEELVHRLDAYQKEQFQVRPSSTCARQSPQCTRAWAGCVAGITWPAVPIRSRQPFAVAAAECVACLWLACRVR
jgi:hypothetical protein